MRTNWDKRSSFIAYITWLAFCHPCWLSHTLLALVRLVRSWS